MGTPAFAVPSLQALHALSDIKLVVTQPDRPQGRGLKLTAPPVKEHALKLGLDVDQPERVRNLEWLERYRSLAPDVVVVVAFGQILPESILSWPKHGCVNVHASLLPRWRGAAPIQWAIRSGDNETGVTIMKMDKGVDTGAMIAKRAIAIDAQDDSVSLANKLSVLGAELLSETLQGYMDGALVPLAQDSALATKAALLKKEDGRIDWGRGVFELNNLVRSMVPWPSAFTMLDGQAIKVLKAKPSMMALSVAKPGSIVGVDAEGIHVACADGVFCLSEVQQAGKARMHASAWWQGLAGQQHKPDHFE